MLDDKDCTIAFLRISSEMPTSFGVLAQFDIHVLQSNKPVEEEVVCKFDSLTFEQLGNLVFLPQRTKHSEYANVDQGEYKYNEERQWWLSSSTASSEMQISTGSTEEDSLYSFPKDVFESDMDFVELPRK